jgi:hypothetical protein
MAALLSSCGSDKEYAEEATFQNGVVSSRGYYYAPKSRSYQFIYVTRRDGTSSLVEVTDTTRFPVGSTLSFLQIIRTEACKEQTTPSQPDKYSWQK